jgi:hypothetical protein
MNFRVNGFAKTVTQHLRSIGPNVQRHMAYFARGSGISLNLVLFGPMRITQLSNAIFHTLGRLARNRSI